MLRAALLLSIIVATFACGDDNDGPGASNRMQTPTVHTPLDAKPADAAAETAADEPERHLDTVHGGRKKPRRSKRPPPLIVRIPLRSSPPGAMVHVDGVPIGVTPTYWEGPATGKRRNFVFTKPDYTMARYRFVPVTDGFVHGRLRKLITPQLDGGAETD